MLRRHTFGLAKIRKHGGDFFRPQMAPFNRWKNGDCRCFAQRGRTFDCLFGLAIRDGDDVASSGRRVKSTSPSSFKHILLVPVKLRKNKVSEIGHIALELKQCVLFLLTSSRCSLALARGVDR